MSDNVIEQAIESYDSDSFIYDINRGIEGLSSGLNNGLGRADEFIHGLQRGTSYLIGAESGIGKSSFANIAHVINPYFDAKAKGIKVHTEYFSWEISKKANKIRFASSLMNKRFGVRLPTSYLLSKGRLKCSQEHLALAKAVAPDIEEMFSTITMHETPMNSKQIIKVLTDLAKRYGRFITREQINEHGDTYEVITGYVPNDPNMYIQVVIDHISLADLDPGLTLKQTMDNISKASVWFRNMCNFIITIIQQFGSDMQSTDRRKLDKTEISPMRSDFADSKYTYRDANIVWGLVSPKMFGFTEYKGYDIGMLGNSYIHAFLMKNRDGFTGAYPMFFDPIAYDLRVLPRPETDLMGEMAQIEELARTLNIDKNKQDFTDQKPRLI